MTELDPIAERVYWRRAVSIADEVGTSLREAAFSSIVRENMDYSAAIFDERGRLLAQATHVATGHIGAMMTMVRSCLESGLALDTPGDIAITNDPWIGCGHTPDVYVVAPVFDGDTRIGFVATSANHVDIGGRMQSTESREVYEEGLILPPVHLARAGVTDQAIRAIIEQNVRSSQIVLGDLDAQVWALEIGARRLRELRSEAGLDALSVLTDAIEDRADQAMRAGIRRLPDGDYHGELTLPVPGAAVEPVTLRVRLSVSGDQVVLDYTGTSAQIDRPINCVLNYTRAYSMLALKLALCPELPNNEGTYRSVRIVAPPGSILNAQFPVAVMFRHTVGLMIPDLVFNALEEACPERILAGNGAAPVWLFAVTGRRRDGGHFLLHSHAMGGMGARHERDGLDSVTFPPNVYSLPTEVLEAETPLLCVRRALRPDSGGAGRFRGGLGEEIELTTVPGGDQDPTFKVVAAVSCGWLEHGPPGRAGGQPGAPGEILVNGRVVAPEESHDLMLADGDRLTLRTPGGGGFGPPERRDPAAVAADVRNGLVTAFGAPDEQTRGRQQTDVSTSQPGTVE